ncbi:hypothetical protein SAMN06295937_10072 [Sphingopyxis flava]|uniref:Uncharacterized protein n=1 Tax=Sphingopyxis flava TaxID=1507287 RepID=A0A1T5BNB3_9SPHN|nr:hypothetical protein SAMN06295937_10072 [Sphingopyxis flava]
MLRAFIKAAHDEIGRLQRREANTDRDIEALGDHVDASVAAFQMHLDGGVLEHEPGDQRAELEVGERNRAAYPNDAARFGADLRDHLFGGLGFDQHGDAAIMELAANLGDGKMARRAVEQAHTQALLQQQDAAAEFGFLNAERASGGREAAVIDRLDEVIK